MRLDEARERIEARGIEVIDLGMGDPREPTEPRIAQALAEALPLVEGYPRAHGLPELRRAIATWAERRFGAHLDPDTEVIPTLGSKEAIFSLAQILVDRDSDRTLVAYTEPGYPVYERGALFAGGEPLPLPLLEANGFLPDLDAVDDDTWSRVALLWVNYPNNPTGALAGLDFYERVAALARRHDFVLGVGRGVHGALVRRAARVGAAARRPCERRRLQHAQQAHLDDRVPLRLRRR